MRHWRCLTVARGRWFRGCAAGTASAGNGSPLPGRKGYAMPGRKVLIGIFDAKADVEEALRQFTAAEVALKSVSVVGRSHHVTEQLCGTCRSAGGAVRYVGRDESFWNDLWARLPGSAFLWLPGVGPLVFAGRLGELVMARACPDPSGAGGGDGAGALRAALGTLGVPDDFGATCESALRADRLLFVTRTPQFQAARTHSLLEQSRSLEIRAYPEPSAVVAPEAESQVTHRRRDVSAV
jgi:hypothetical protein